MNKDIEKFNELCEYYILKNIELSTGIPTNTKFKINCRYLLIYLDMLEKENPLLSDMKVLNYLKTCAYGDEFIANVVQRASIHDRMLELLDYVESYIVDEIEKCLYGHGNKCYTSLHNSLSLVLHIKQEKYKYGYESISDLLERGYYFSKVDADRFDELATFHTSEECPD
jgi:hypothetical protein